MTLGCGGYGGNITSDNISPRHLLNIKRLAYELRPAPRAGAAAASAASPAPAPAAPPLALPKVPTLPATHEIEAAAIREELASYLAGRGRSAPAVATPPRDAAASAAVVDFVCEEDVRRAIAQGRTILVGERTIITPAARDLGEARRVFVQAGWPHR
jgi:hypothetical protein